MLYSADLETTTEEDDCRVWAWSLCEIGNTNNFHYDNNLDSLMKFMEESDNSTFYFHNIKFDADPIMIWMFEHGFKHIVVEKDEKGRYLPNSDRPASKTFTTLIDSSGQYYSLKIYFEVKSKKTKFVQLYDSYKIIPLKVANIAKAFGLKDKKLKISYKKFRPIGHTITPDELDYIRNDVVIVADALQMLFNEGLDRITQGSNALHDYKETVGKKNFDTWFPIPDYDAVIRPSYRGGFTYANPEFKELNLLNMLTLDVNSLYPWVLHDCKLPYGVPIYFKGKYEQDELYNVYVQEFSCRFEVKEGYLPTLQAKNNFKFTPTEYLTSSKYYEPDDDVWLDEPVELVMTNVDLELFKEHYHIYEPQWHRGWKFKSTDMLFKAYIDKWTQRKIKASREGNKGQRTISKLMQNALYGKFGTNPLKQSKIPYLNEGRISYRNGEKKMEKPLYIPIATFVTSYARAKTIRSAQQVKDIFVYADTDSLHLNVELPPEILAMNEDQLAELTTQDLINYGIPIPEDFWVDPVALGAWKVEGVFHRARFIRAKCYIEDGNPPETWDKAHYNSQVIKEFCEENSLDFEDEIAAFNGLYNKSDLKITCAGMQAGCYQYVSWENFHVGSSYRGKLKPKHVKGGIVLLDDVYTIRRC